MSLRRLLAAALPLLTTAGAAPLAAEPAGTTPPVPAVVEARPRKAPDNSFLFSSQALGLIEAARAGEQLAALPRARSAPTAAADSLHLAAIVYHGPDDWRIWLNGQSFTPQARPRAIEILQVTAEAVVLAWRTGPGAGPTRIRLQPNQSYLVASGRIVEGEAGSRR